MLNCRLKDLGLEIKEMREERNLSQSELAEKAGITQQIVSDIENGDINFEIQTFFDITNALECHAYFTLYKAEDDL